MIRDERVFKTFKQERSFSKRRSESLYLGGAPNNDVIGLTGNLYSNPFTGCISHLEIRKRTPKSFGGVIDIKTNSNNKNVLEWDGISCQEKCRA